MQQWQQFLLWITMFMYMNGEPRSIRKRRLFTAYHPDLVRPWLSQYWSDRCPELWCSAPGFTQPHLTLHHSPHIRLWAWYALLGSGTLPERELVKCQLTWALPEDRPLAVNLALGAGGQFNNAVPSIIHFCFWDLYLEIGKLLLLSVEPWLYTESSYSLFLCQCFFTNSEHSEEHSYIMEKA